MFLIVRNSFLCRCCKTNIDNFDIVPIKPLLRSLWVSERTPFAVSFTKLNLSNVRL